MRARETGLLGTFDAMTWLHGMMASHLSFFGSGTETGDLSTLIKQCLVLALNSTIIVDEKCNPLMRYAP